MEALRHQDTSERVCQLEGQLSEAQSELSAVREREAVVREGERQRASQAEERVSNWSRSWQR